MGKARQKKEEMFQRLPDIHGTSFKARYLRRIKSQLKYASLGRRFLAFLIDFLLSSILVSIIPMIITSIVTQEKAFTIDNMMKLSIPLQIACCMIAVVAAVFYFCISPINAAHPGQTLGKRATHIRVARMDGKEITLSDMLKRELIGSMLLEGETAFPSAFVRYMLFMCIPSPLARILTTASIVLSLGSIIWCIISKHRRMLHDYVARTNVVDL